MDAIRVTWEDAAVASSFHSDGEDAVPELGPSSDCSSSTYQSDYSQAKLSLDVCNELQKDEDLTDWVSEEHAETLPARRTVSFKDVEVRCYAIIPGVHPDCNLGPPLSIDWDHFKASSYSVDEFEAKRQAHRKPAMDLRLGWWNRRCILRRLGFSDEDMKQVEESSQRTRKRRESTSSRSKLSKIEEIQQKIMRKLGRALYPKVTLQTKY
ncbi:hypothetical protein MPSEU_000502700 [Mayamaea pseudoterrestris]|nr:hypothetical protein MPSEU_000502700 [Mayamaea pseudoterrestris]